MSSARVPARFGNQPSLDGLRAVSVLAVIAYHAGATWMTGGFYGVEVFFVVSGFLITSLLLDERERHGRLDLRQFWIRRARRLLPALVVMLVAVATWTWMFGSAEQQSTLRRDLPWGLGYLANWGQIVGKVPYYASTDPPLLRHLWSLAVEEQWYLLWPLAFAGMAALGWTSLRRARVLLGAFVVVWIGMIVASVGFGRPITVPLLGTVDRTNLLYLSSLTRAGGLLLGAAAAFVWRPWRSAGGRRRQRQLTALECVGAAALTLLVLTFTAAHLAEAATFRWTLPIVSVLSTVVVCVAVHPGAPTLRRLLGTPWLVAIGRRSYGLYLWHWPIFVLCGAPGGAGWRVGLALFFTVVCSELCYRHVETPIRTGAWRQFLAESRGYPRPSLAASTMFVALPVLLLVALVVHYSAVRPFDRAAGGRDVTFAAVPDPTAAPGASDPAPAAPTTTVAPDLRPRVALVGDSMAHALYVNRPKALASTLALSDGSIDGCDVFDGGTAVSSTGFELPLGQCKSWAQRWAKTASSHQADVALVVVGAWDVLDVVRPDGSRLTFGTKPFDDAYLAQLQQGIDAVAATGAKVAFLEVACMRPVDAEGAATPPLPERADDSRVAHLSSLMRTAVRRNSGVAAFVTGPPEWCDGSPIATDPGYRWDGVHVYKPGAALVFQTVVPQLTSLTL
ncbi:MAG: acyltransferase family protein [Ilumatobacteraceae bacterium]